RAKVLSPCRTFPALSLRGARVHIRQKSLRKRRGKSNRGITPPHRRAVRVARTRRPQTRPCPVRRALPADFAKRLFHDGGGLFRRVTARRRPRQQPFHFRRRRRPHRAHQQSRFAEIEHI